MLVVVIATSWLPERLLNQEAGLWPASLATIRSVSGVTLTVPALCKIECRGEAKACPFAVPPETRTMQGAAPEGMLTDHVPLAAAGVVAVAPEAHFRETVPLATG